MEGVAAIGGLLSVIFVIVLAIVLILAPIKLYSIDSNLRHIQTQLHAISGQIEVESRYLSIISDALAKPESPPTPPRAA